MTYFIAKTTHFAEFHDERSANRLESGVMNQDAELEFGDPSRNVIFQMLIQDCSVIICVIGGETLMPRRSSAFTAGMVIVAHDNKKAAFTGGL